VVEHPKHTHKGVFQVFKMEWKGRGHTENPNTPYRVCMGVRDKGNDASDTIDMPTRACLWCSRRREIEGMCQTSKHVPQETRKGE